MKHFAFVLLLSAFLLGVLRPAQAAFMTGKALLAMCNSQDADNVFACENYIAGVIDYHVLVKSLGTAPSVDFCLPDGLKMQQITIIVRNYLAQRQEQHGFVAAPAVALALYNSYPCSRKGK